MIKLHDIRIYIFIHGIVLFILRPLATFVYGATPVTGSVNILIYTISTIWCLIALLICIFAMKKLPSDQWLAPNKTLRISPFRYFLAFFVWAIVTFYFFQDIAVGQLGDLLQSTTSEYIHGDKVFIPNTLTAVGTIFVFAIFYLDSSRTLKLTTSILIITILVSLGLMSGSKTLALAPFFAVVIMWSRINKGVPLTALLVLSIFFITAQIVLDAARSTNLETAFTNSILFYFSGSSLEDGVRLFLNRYYGTDIFYRIYLYHGDDNVQFLYGSSLLVIVWAFIPRAIWPDKPLISFGKNVSETYLDDNFWGTGISAAPTWIGELYANFGFLSLAVYILSAVAIARHIRVCQDLSAPVWARELYFPISFTTIAFFQEASIVGWVTQLIALGISSFLIGVLLFGGKKAMGPGI